MPRVSATDISREDAQIELLRRKCLSDLSTFIKTFWPVLNPGTPLIWSWYHDAICRHLEAVYYGRVKRFGQAMPPGLTKSTIISILWPLWVWCHDPTKTFISCTHQLFLSHKFNAKRLIVIKSERFQKIMKPTWTVGGDTAANKGFLQNSMMGEIIATAVGAGITGQHAWCIIIDDPLTPDVAYSSHRHDHITYWEDVLQSRSANRADMVLVCTMQRLCVGDQLDYFEKTGFLTSIMVLPAIYDSKLDRGPTEIGWFDPRKPGELLDPIRLPMELCNEQKKKARRWQAQYMQAPSAGDSGVIREEWFRYYSVIPPNCQYFGCWDLTFDNDGDDPDMVSGQVWAFKDANMYLVDHVYGTMGFVDATKAMQAMAEKHPYVGRWYVEKKANGAAALDTLKRSVRGLVPVTSSSPKDIRVAAWSGAVESGNVYLPDNKHDKSVTDKRSEFITQCVGFGQTRYDDIPDCASMLAAVLGPKVGGVQVTVGDTVFSADGTSREKPVAYKQVINTSWMRS